MDQQVEIDAESALEALLVDPAPEPSVMSDDELIRVIDQELEHAYGADQEVIDHRTRAISAYRGEARFDFEPPSVAGRSTVVSRDLQETVAAMMPSLMRTFCGSEEVARFEPRSALDAQSVEDATAYCNYVLMRRNPGYQLLYSAIKNALIQREGYLKVTYGSSWEQSLQSFYGLSEGEIQLLSGDPSVEIEQITEAEPAQVPGPDGMPVAIPRFDAVVRKREGRRYCRVDGVPPEEMRIDRDARTIDEVRFAAHCREVSASELLDLGFGEDVISQLQEFAESDAQGEDTERTGLYDGGVFNNQPAEESLRLFEITDAWLLVDYDRDGRAEWRHVMKSGGTVLVNEPADGHPFVLFTPSIMPYRLVGESVWDVLSDVMRVKTTMLRQTVDNMVLANNQRVEALQGAVNLEDLVVARPGGVVRVTQPGAVRMIETPLIAGQSLPVLQYMDAIGERRTGVSEISRGLDPSSVNTKASGFAIDLMQAGAREQVELIARTIAETAIKRLFRLILKCVTQYQNEPEQVRLNGRWLEFDPRGWSNQYDITVSVGINAQSRQAQIAALDSIYAMQMDAMERGYLGPQHAPLLMRTMRRKLEVMGFRDADQFLPPDEALNQPEPPDPMKDPAVVAAQLQSQALIQSEAVKARQRTDEAQIRAQVDVALAQIKAETERETSAIEVASKERIAAAELNRDWAELEQKSIDAMERVSGEASAAREQIAEEAIARATAVLAEAGKKVAPSKPRVKVSSIRKAEDGSYVVDTIEQDADEDDPAPEESPTDGGAAP